MYQVRIAPGCHSGPGLGPIVDEDRSFSIAIGVANRSDRLAVYNDDELVYQIPAQGHPRLGPGRWGRGLYRWAVVIDGSIESTHRTRDDARAEAAWWRRHPSMMNRRRFGHGGKVCVEDMHIES